MSCIHAIAYTEGAYRRVSHWHPTDQLILVLKGRVQLRISDQTYTVCRPSVIFISHLESHSFLHTSDDYRRYVVDIDPSESVRQLSDWDRLMSPFLNRPEKGSHVYEVGEWLPVLRGLCQLLLEEQPHRDYDSGQEALLQVILHYLFRKIPEAFPYQPDPTTGMIRRLQRRLDTAPESSESLQELADTCHFSVSYLARSFKKTTGYSIGQYRLLCRIAHAKTLLTETKLPIAEIAERCGISDASNFSRFFLREVGRSPSDFRKYHSGNPQKQEN